MVITMHLRVGSISQADKVIPIYFLLNLLRRKRTNASLLFIVTSFALAYISFNEFIARQLKSQIKILKAVLQN